MTELVPQAHEFKWQFFSGLEPRLVAHAAARQTVSPGVAELMSADHGAQFDLVNAAPDEDAGVEPPAWLEAETCIFLFRRSFETERGIDVLIDAWPETPPSAILHLQGPDNPLKRRMIERAEATGRPADPGMWADSDPPPVPPTMPVSAERRLGRLRCIVQPLMRSIRPGG
ncbi:hypothetical protein ACLBX9_04115 [Methylobacterium sp. A49B]